MKRAREQLGTGHRTGRGWECILLSLLIGCVTFVCEVDKAHAEPSNYRASVSQSMLFVMVFKDPEALGAKLSHDHVVRARSFDGEIRWDPKDPSACQVSFKVPVKDLDPDPIALRKRVGLTRMLSRDTRDQVKAHLLGKDQLWAEKHPFITFSATRCTPKGEKTLVEGQFSLRGQTRSVSTLMKIRLTKEGKQLNASGSLALKHSWFGFEPYSALGGTLRNKDDLRVVIAIRAAPYAR